MIINIIKCIDVKYAYDIVKYMDYKESTTYLRELWGVYSKLIHTVISLHRYDITLIKNLITTVKYHANIVN